MITMMMMTTTTMVMMKNKRKKQKMNIPLRLTSRVATLVQAARCTRNLPIPLRSKDIPLALGSLVPSDRLSRVISTFHLSVLPSGKIVVLGGRPSAVNRLERVFKGSKVKRAHIQNNWRMVLWQIEFCPRMNPVRLDSPSYSWRRRYLNLMYRAPCVAAVQLKSTPVITCDHPFIL